MKAEALVALEQSGDQRSAVKDLQRQWKAVGFVPEAKAKALWNRFRRACNKALRGPSGPGAGPLAGEPSGSTDDSAVKGDAADVPAPGVVDAEPGV